MKKEVIGNATLYLGDCLEVLPEIDVSIDAVIADPPYQITGNDWDSLIDLDKMWEVLSIVIKPNAAIVLTASQPFTTELIGSNRPDFKYEWIWHKSRPTGWLQHDFMPMKEHENICVFCREGKPTFNPQKTTNHAPTNSSRGHGHGEGYGNMSDRNYSGGNTTRNPKTILKFKSDRGFHPTQKPVHLFEYLIQTYTDPAQTVLDFSMGSGTTGVACMNLGRKFIGIELEPQYFDIACERIEMTQKQGRLFA